MNLAQYQKLYYEIEIWTHAGSRERIKDLLKSVRPEDLRFRKIGDIAKIVLEEVDPLKRLKSFFMYEKHGLLPLIKQKKDPRAYVAWRAEEENLLKSLWEQGRSIEEAASMLQRSDVAVRLRLIGLGLLDDTKVQCMFCDEVIALDDKYRQFKYCEKCAQDRVCDGCGLIIDELWFYEDGHEKLCEECFEAEESEK
jgi:hypothetical protein